MSNQSLDELVSGFEQNLSRIMSLGVVAGLNEASYQMRSEYISEFLPYLDITSTISHIGIRALCLGGTSSSAIMGLAYGFCAAKYYFDHKHSDCR